ncbi:MAG: phosphopantetheine-binding protein [Duganella sp.]
MNKHSALRDTIVTLAGETLGVGAFDIATGVNIQDLGFNSVLLVSFVEKVSAALDDDIHPGVFFEHATLDAFVGYLVEHKSDKVDRHLSMVAADMARAMPAPATVDGGGQPHPRPLTRGTRGEIPQDVPVIIGGGIGGMLISRALCRKHIRHVLVGSPQLGDTPKLGESMTEACTIEFTQDFEGYDRYLFAKNYTPFFMGDIVAGLRFDFFGTMASLFLEKAPRAFIHVDRIGFDQALYDEVSAAEECYWIDDLVTDVDYEKDSDRLQLLKLKNGTTIRPSYAWDCTNHIRLLGRKLDIPFQNFDQPRQVIFTHYMQKDCEDLCHRADLPWMHATTLLRAETEFDQLNGVSWFIPLGKYVSVGISMAPEDIGDRNPEEIITALTKAYKNRGIDYSREFARRKEIVSVPSQHFMYERFYGANWAMVGGCAASTWFTSGSQISMLACMAAMADRIVEQPQVYGEHYSRHVRGFAKTQRIYDTLLTSGIGPLDAMKFLSGIVEQARGRISSYYMFRKGLDTPAARTAKELWEEQVVVDKDYFAFLKQIATHAQPARRQEQADAIFAKLAEMHDASRTVRIPYLRNSQVREEKAALFL